MPLLFLSLALQIAIAIAIVIRNGMVHIKHPLDVEAATMVKRRSIAKLKARFDLSLQIATTVSIALNMAVHAFFAARVLETDGKTSTGNDTK